MGNTYKIPVEVRETLRSVPEHRKEIEKAVGLAIKDASTVPTIVKILLGGTTITLASAIIYIAYRQNSPWSPKKSIPLISGEYNFLHPVLNCSNVCILQIASPVKLS